MKRPAIFLDRDGVLIEELVDPRSGERRPPLDPSEVRQVPRASAALAAFAQSGYALVVISNQAAFARGKATLRALSLVHERFVALFGADGISFDRVFYAYGHPDGVVAHFSGPAIDRKPSPYYVLVAAAQLDLDLSRSWFIGDQQSDIDCACAAGVRPILIEGRGLDPTGNASVPRADDLDAAAKFILDSGRDG